MFPTNTKYFQHVFLSVFVCGIGGGGGEGMGGGIQNNIYGKIRFILKKKIQVYSYVHRLAIEGYMRNYFFLDLQHLYTLHM